MIRFRYLAIFAAAGLGLAGCHDARRDVVRDYLQSHPPEGFEVVAVPENFNIASAVDGTSEAVVTMRYRLAQPTIVVRELLAQPSASKLVQRLNAVRGWALSALPAGDPVRESITAGSAAALTPFSIKQVVTPKGTEIADAVSVTLRKEADGWHVNPPTISVNTPGLLDKESQIPFESSPDVTAKLGELEVVTSGLEASRQKYLADRQRTAARSLANFRSLLKTGDVFEGELKDHTPIRLVISQGAETARTLVAVLTIERPEISSARYTGAVVQEPSGEMIWRAAQVTSLSGMRGDLLTDASLHPILTISALGANLIAKVKNSTGQSVTVKLSPIGAADLIPDHSS